MKRVLSLILALVMLLAMFTMVGATESPDAAESTEAPAEPAPAEELTEAPAEPAPEVTETVTEPAAEPTVEPAADPTDEPAAEPTEEPSAEPTAEPVVEPTEAPVEPTAEPVVEPVAAPPAENSVAPASLPTEIPVQPTPAPDHRTVELHANGGYFTGDHAGYDGFPKALDGDKLPKTDGEGYPGAPNWYTPERPGYRFLGWYEEKDLGALSPEKALKEGDKVPENVTKLFAGWMRVLVLDAEPGNFTDKDQNNMIRTVDVPNGQMPDVSKYTPVFDYDNPKSEEVKFVGWYTEKSKVETGSGEGYTTWSIKPQGQQIELGSPLNENITTLYAGYESKATAESPRKIVTYYYDWNGINGMWGQCLTSSRAYEEGVGHTLTAEDLLIYGLNWDGSKTNPAKVETQQDLTDYWASNPYNGYTFKGWATSPEMDTPDVHVDSTVTNGQSIYAVWSKADGSDNKAFVEEGGRDKKVGPLTHVRFLDLRTSVHGTQDASVDLSMYTTPKDADLSGLTVTWTVNYSATNVKAISRFAPPVTKTVTVTKDSGVVTLYENALSEDKKDVVDGAAMLTVQADGARGLKIVDLDGNDHALTVSVKITGMKDGGEIESPAPAEVIFTHNWEKDDSKPVVQASCTKNGEQSYKCSQCGGEKTVYTPMLPHVWDYIVTTEPGCTTTGVKQDACYYCHISYEDYMTAMNERGKSPHTTTILAPTGHEYVVTGEKVGVENGAAVYKVSCSQGDSETQLKCGDINADESVDVTDAMALFYSSIGKYDKHVDGVLGDTNNDGSVDVTDAMKLFYFALGKVNEIG